MWVWVWVYVGVGAGVGVGVGVAVYNLLGFLAALAGRERRNPSGTHGIDASAWV